MSYPTLRDATLADLPTISDIYNYYVLNSTCTYALVPETLAERQAWFALHSADKYPVVVVDVDGQVLGWGSLSKFHARAGYDPTVEASVYIAHGMHRRGLGRMILEHLIARAERPATTRSSAAPAPIKQPASPCKRAWASSRPAASKKSAKNSAAGSTSSTCSSCCNPSNGARRS